MKQQIVKLLKSAGGDFVSGQLISEKLNVSRAAIWKYMNALKEEGYEIESVSRKGYRLIESADVLTSSEVEKYLTTTSIGRNLVYFKTIGSTNDEAKRIAFNTVNGTVVVSEEQTNGRGRLGRVWSSPIGKGIWMSVVLKPDIIPEKVSRITLIGAAAVCKALQEMGVEPQIKWPNDLLLSKKKLCGILTEMSAELNHVNYIVMGIGINVNIELEEYPEELREVATSLKIATGEEFNRQELMARILNNLEKLYTEFVEKDDMSESIRVCKENSLLIGEKVFLIERGGKREVKVIDIDEAGELIVINENGEMETIISGEVSVRGF